MRNYFVKALILLFVFALTLPACAPQVTEIPVIVETATTVPPVNTTATPAKRSLTICLGEEPNTLYPYGSLNAAARSVLSAIYDGPVGILSIVLHPMKPQTIRRFNGGGSPVLSIPVTTLIFGCPCRSIYGVNHNLPIL